MNNGKQSSVLKEVVFAILMLVSIAGTLAVSGFPRFYQSVSAAIVGK